MRTRLSLRTWGSLVGAVGALAVIVVMALGLADAAVGLLVLAGFAGAALAVFAAGEMTRAVEGRVEALADSAQTLADDRIYWAARIGPDCLEEIPASPDVHRKDALGELARWHDRLLASAVEAAHEVANRPIEPEVPVIAPAAALRGAVADAAALERLRASATRALSGDRSLDVRLGVEHSIAQLERAHRTGLVLAGIVPESPATEPLDLAVAVERAIAASDSFTRLAVPTPVHDGAPVAIVTSAVDDVVHLVAELIDRALTCAGPDGRLTVRGAQHRLGRVISLVEDPATASTSRTVDRSERATLAATDREVVIERLSTAHGIRVSPLADTADGHVTHLLIPAALLTESVPVPASALSRSHLRLIPGAGDADIDLVALEAQEAAEIAAVAAGGSPLPRREPGRQLHAGPRHLVAAAARIPNANDVRTALRRWQEAVAAARAAGDAFRRDA